MTINLIEKNWIDDFIKTDSFSEALGMVWRNGGTAEIHVILSISHTFISKRTCNHGFPYYLSTY